MHLWHVLANAAVMVGRPKKTFMDEWMIAFILHNCWILLFFGFTQKGYSVSLYESSSLKLYFTHWEVVNRRSLTLWHMLGWVCRYLTCDACPHLLELLILFCAAVVLYLLQGASRTYERHPSRNHYFLLFLTATQFPMLFWLGNIKGWCFSLISEQGHLSFFSSKFKAKTRSE